LDKRVVVEVEAELHRELRKIAVINDLKIYELANAILHDCLGDDAHLKAIVKGLKR
jgi:hypothetical protein